MAFFKSRKFRTPSTKTIFSLLQLFMLLVFIPSVKATTFKYPSFESVPKNLILQGNASSTSGFIQLTTNRRDACSIDSIGRAVYAEPVHLWDLNTGEVADFSTQFSFTISQLNPDPTIKDGAEGLAFFLAPNGSTIPPDSGGSCLGLYSENFKFDSSKNPVVAIEFDTYPNEWDPRPPSTSSNDHVGLDINSIKSVATMNIRNNNLNNGSTIHVRVSYNSSATNLSVYLSFGQKTVVEEHYWLYYVVDLKEYLPEWINVGFSSAALESCELHNILSWEFNSTEFLSSTGNGGGKGTGGGEAENGTRVGTGGGAAGNGTRVGTGGGAAENGAKVGTGAAEDRSTIRLMIGLVVGGSVLVVGVGSIFFVWRKRSNQKKDEDDVDDISTDKDYDKGTGPKRFTYGELARATSNFTEKRKLGEGGFGGVYRGILSDSKAVVAVKRISSGSRQGKKEFVSEVKIISQLRHPNLVQLIGWCHERRKFLLVYEFMPNGSLDFHLFGGRTNLTWVLRYKIALSLASALLYLHEEWEQCVVHRDIKSSNVMLDSSFDAKLGDFGLARFADHQLGLKTTKLAGTMGYLAPECVVTGKAGKESDVYSFGVVALEIACGRRVVEPKEEKSKEGLVAWVWELYGSGRLLEAADTKLRRMDFNEEQIQRLMVVGLWCANLDHNLRPSMRQAISVLNFEAPLPDLPFKMSVPTYFTPSMQDLRISYTSSSSATDTVGNHSQSSGSSLSTNSSNFNKEAGKLIEQCKLNVVSVSPAERPSPVSEGSDEEGSLPRASLSENVNLNSSDEIVVSGGSSVPREKSSEKVVNGSSSSIKMSSGELERKKMKRYSCGELTSITRNFTNEIGSGAYGDVFQGTLPNGLQVAVKKLKDNAVNVMEMTFMTEVRTMSSTSHRNLVRLYGYCFESNMKALIYEYLENGSLDKVLYENHHNLRWEKLYEIAIGIAKGISYLHESCDEEIVHYDIKPGNVLLDSKFSPKVADFGVAKIFQRDLSHVSVIEFRGTRSYAAPEMWMAMPGTPKSDIYSFGMILFEILRRGKDFDGQNWFPGQVWEKFKNEQLDDILEYCGIDDKNKVKAKLLSTTALWCTQFNPNDRPTMSDVVQVLKGNIQLKSPPNPCYPCSFSPCTSNREVVPYMEVSEPLKSPVSSRPI